MLLLGEEQLLQFVEYWAANLSMLDEHPRPRVEKTSTIVFYLMHHPELLPTLKNCWQRTVKEWVNRIKCTSDYRYRTQEVKEYFHELYQGFVQMYGAIPVFQYRYQNWNVAGFETIVDQLWTLLCTGEGA